MAWIYQILELECAIAIEAILERYTNDASFGDSEPDEPRVTEAALEEEAAWEEEVCPENRVGESDVALEPVDRSPIETKFSSTRMQRIRDHFVLKGRSGCLKKFGITYSQLRAVTRHFESGPGDHVKCAKIRSSVATEVKKVCPHLDLFS